MLKGSQDSSLIRLKSDQNRQISSVRISFNVLVHYETEDLIFNILGLFATSWLTRFESFKGSKKPK